MFHTSLLSVKTSWYCIHAHIILDARFETQSWTCHCTRWKTPQGCRRILAQKFTWQFQNDLSKMYVSIALSFSNFMNLINSWYVSVTWWLFLYWTVIIVSDLETLLVIWQLHVFEIILIWLSNGHYELVCFASSDILLMIMDMANYNWVMVSSSWTYWSIYLHLEVSNNKEISFCHQC